MPTLTDADKVLRNDVGKRMADALEAIAEGSGGSAKIEEMTQAEYDALTPEQKADGTLRAISDGETKIQDIDNVNITTSDNGKLLGVSVSGSDISVSAVETTAADIPYSAGVSVADKLGTIDETLNKFGFNKIKTQTFTGLTIPANNIDTRDLTLTVPADYGILCGFSLANTANCSIVQCYFNSTTSLHTRILNHASQQDSYSFVIFYI